MTTSMISSGSEILSRSDSGPVARLLQPFGRAWMAWRRAATKSELRSLSKTQLRDAGIDIGQVCSGPVIPVDGDTVRKLMSMR